MTVPHRVRAVAAVVVALVMVGGCGLLSGSGAVKPSKESVAPSTTFANPADAPWPAPGTVDQFGNVVVTAEQKEALGYQRPEDLFDPPESQVEGFEHLDEIYSLVKAQVPEAIGQEIVPTGLDFDSINFGWVTVYWRTTSEPFIMSTASVQSDRNGVPAQTLLSDNYHVESGGSQLEEATVDWLQALAFRSQTDALNAYIASTYPQYTHLPVGYQETGGASMRWTPDSVSSIAYAKVPLTELPGGAWSDAVHSVYVAYEENPDRTAEEWRQLITDAFGGDWEFNLDVNMMLTDPATPPTEAMVDEIGGDLAANPLTAGLGSVTVGVASNLMTQDGRSFHHSIVKLFYPDGSAGVPLDLWDGSER